MLDLNTLSLPDLFATLVPGESLRRLLETARDEDLGGVGDVTSLSIIDPAERGVAAVVPRAAGVAAGLAAAPAILDVFEADLRLAVVVEDGAACVDGEAVMRLDGTRLDLLAVERTLLNLVGRLSGIATATRRYVDATAGTRAVICDTRKTTPGLRGLEKYAVRCGGGTLHRIGLHDAALYKDNHLAGLDPPDLGVAVARAAAEARRHFDLRFVEVEVDGLDQLDAVLAVAEGLIDIVLLDNFGVAPTAEAVCRRDRIASGVLLESSGGVIEADIGAIASTGVDRIAVGALTHSSPALDVGLDMEVA